MGIDEALFARVYRWFARRARRGDAVREERAVRLESLEKRVSAFAALLAGRALEVRAADDHGGVRGERLFLPARLDAAPTAAGNVAAYLLRTALLVEVRLGAVAACAEREGVSRALASLLHAREIVERASRRWPGFAELFARVGAEHEFVPSGDSAAERVLRALEGVRCGRELADCERGLPPEAQRFLRHAVEAGIDRLPLLLPVWRALPGARSLRRCVPSFFPDLLCSEDGSRARAAMTQGGELPTREALPTGTERRAPARREVEVVELEEEEDQNPLIHVFEKVKTVEEHQAGHRRLDGSDELEQHLEALEELDLRRVIRSRAPTASVYRADLALEGGSADLEDDAPRGEALLYDEWDEGARRHRRAWCSVYASDAEAAPAESTAAAARAVRGRQARVIRALRGELERLERTRALRRRQIAGSDVDLDAVVDRHAALLAARRSGGSVEDQRLYLARRPSHRELATFVLLDASLSTDSWIENRRVLDVARESLVVLGEVLHEQHLRVGVAAFFSNARRDCRFQMVKDFDEPWSLGYRRLFGLRPTGYTRIGPAVRHATRLLERAGGAKKLLVLIGDGKPTDYDRYEGRYGIADVRQALREARASGIRSVALTIDARAKSHLPALFGPGGYRLLRHPRDLPLALARLEERLLR
ncbi:MAG: VWA domain-containing protein [Planctomycetes bacterium]|nr:VWA domain-containing protein [Planctomycetota bacterium]